MTSARFFVAQYIPDPFRKESTNVGVFVEVAGAVACRFFAEREDGRVEKTAARRRVNYPGVYQQWVEFWRSCALRGPEGIQEAIDEPTGNFQVVDGGMVDGLNGDSAERVATEVFGRLIDPAADSRPIAQKGMPRFESTLRRVFTEARLTERSLHVQHPIKANESIKGTTTYHTPSFIQINGELDVMEAVFVGKAATSKRVSEKAGATAYMFDDIHNRLPSAKMIAIVNVAPEVASDSSVDRLRQLLVATSNVIVNWRDEDERETFLEERRERANPHSSSDSDPQEDSTPES